MYLNHKNTKISFQAALSKKQRSKFQSLGFKEQLIFIIMITLCKILTLWFTDIVTLSIQTLNIQTVEEHIKNNLKNYFYFNNY